jgi:hypothetical protein
MRDLSTKTTHRRTAGENTIEDDDVIMDVGTMSRERCRKDDGYDVAFGEIATAGKPPKKNNANKSPRARVKGREENNNSGDKFNAGKIANDMNKRETAIQTDKNPRRRAAKSTPKKQTSTPQVRKLTSALNNCAKRDQRRSRIQKKNQRDEVSVPMQNETRGGPFDNKRKRGRAYEEQVDGDNSADEGIVDI